jgi:hypothetical protein
LQWQFASICLRSLRPRKLQWREAAQYTANTLKVKAITPYHSLWMLCEKLHKIWCNCALSKGFVANCALLPIWKSSSEFRDPDLPLWAGPSQTQIGWHQSARRLWAIEYPRIEVSRMTRSKAFFGIAIMIPILALCPHLVASTVTSGYIEVLGGVYAGSFSLTGPGFSADGAFDVFNFSALNYGPVSPGSQISIYGNASGNDFRNGSATIGGTYFPYVIWGDLFAQGPSFFELNGPVIPLGFTAGTYYGTFDFFIGSLCGTLGNELPAPCVADLPGLGGSGVVSVDVSSPVGYLWIDRVTYTFTTPEPATLALLPPALLAAGAALRCRWVK